MFRNVAGQKFSVFAFDSATGLPKTGDAANITAYVSKDNGAVTALADTGAAEDDATNAKGYYTFDATQGETDADKLKVTAKSSTAGIVVVGAPAVIFTRPTTGWLAPTVAGRTLAVASSGEADANAVKISGDSTAADNLETAFDDTAGPVPWLGIVDQGTAQGATSTTLQLRAAAAFADDALNGALVGVLGSTQGYWQFSAITDYDGATDTATVAAWPVTPTGTITYKIFGAASASLADVQSAAEDALAAYGAATGANVTAVPAAVLSAAIASPIHAAIKIVNNTTVKGTGVAGDRMRSTAVP